MATTVDTLLVRIEADMADLRRDLNKVASHTEKTADRMRDSFAKVGRAIAAIGGTAVMGSFIKSTIGVGAEVENLGVRFNTLFGSVEEGSKAFETMAQFASEVPFSLQDIQRGAAPLATVGKNAKQLGTLMKLTGNIAAASGMSFEEASQNVQRALTAGINSADMFRERGVSAMAGFQAGTSYSVDETLKKLNEAFGAGGKYDGITDELAKTTTGALSMLGDSYFNFQRVIAESGLNEAFVELVNVLKEVLDAAKPFGVIIGSVLAFAFRKLADAINFVRENLRSFIFAIGVYLSLALATNVSIAVVQFAKMARAIKASGIAMRFFNQVTKRTPLLLIAAALGYTADQLGLIEEAAEHASQAFEQLLPEEVRRNMDKFGKGFLEDVNEAIGNINGDDNEPITISVGTASSARELDKVKKLLEDAKNPAAELREQIALLEGALGGLSGAARHQAVNALELLREQLREMEPMYAATKDAVISMAQGMSNAFADALVEGKNAMESLKNVFKSFVKTMIAKALELYVFNHIINAVFGLSGQAALPTRTMFSAGGGSIQPNVPTVVGERGPELIVPSSGGSKVLNNMNANNAMGGGATIVNQTINVQAGVAQTVRAEMLTLLPKFKQDTMDAVVDAKRRGGSFGQAFG